MQHFFPNSKTAVVQIPSNQYSGSITEVDKFADDIGQHGNIMDYSVQKEGMKTSIIFKLAVSHSEFVTK